MINVNDNFIPSIFMKMTEWSWTSGSITGTLFDSRGKGGRHGGMLNGKALQKEMGGKKNYKSFIWLVCAQYHKPRQEYTEQDSKGTKHLMVY